jgi:hypothetical protein
LTPSKKFERLFKDFENSMLKGFTSFLVLFDAFSFFQFQILLAMQYTNHFRSFLLKTNANHENKGNKFNVSLNASNKLAIFFWFEWMICHTNNYG